MNWSWNLLATNKIQFASTFFSNSLLYVLSPYYVERRIGMGVGVGGVGAQRGQCVAFFLNLAWFVLLMGRIFTNTQQRLYSHLTAFIFTIDDNGVIEK